MCCVLVVWLVFGYVGVVNGVVVVGWCVCLVG